LKKAWLYVMLLPVGTVAFFHLLRKLQGEFGKATNFIVRVRGATSTFGRSTNVEWPASNAEDMADKAQKVSERMNFGQAMDPETAKMADVYKNISKEKKEKME